MEPSEIFGGTEECQSSESGWTKYIGSPIQGGDDDGDDDGHSEADETDDANHEADHSDDSMASDASSGPSHQGQFYGNMAGGHGSSTYFKHDEDEEEGGFYLDKKAKKSMEKQKLGMKKKEEKEVKEQMTFKAKGATTTDPSRSDSKVIKNISWLRKRN